MPNIHVYIQNIQKVFIQFMLTMIILEENNQIFIYIWNVMSICNII